MCFFKSRLQIVLSTSTQWLNLCRRKQDFRFIIGNRRDYCVVKNSTLISQPSKLRMSFTDVKTKHDLLLLIFATFNKHRFALNDIGICVSLKA